ncbi:MAG: adenosylcobinamide-phosphate synthase CbiB [Proteobacteria bacterium]|nr:adenosylcobinamide-phosphate synthase CbiB [Pseudomonadota bacterium]
MEINHGIIFLFIFVLAFCLDIVVGDPPYLPHPVRFIGKLITIFERLLRKAFKNDERFAGVLLTTLIAGSVFLITYILEKWILFGLKGFYRYVGLAVLVYLTATTLAARELINAAMRVINAVKEGKISVARQHLSMIVGRDVVKLNEKGILRATIETLSENLSDGVIAPIFYLTIGGLPLAMSYKAVNTLDSMVGYKNEKYINLGWASARLDDVFNYIPSRLSGILIALSSGIIYKSRVIMLNALKTAYHDGEKHLSPNSGYPEAAMAGALGIMLGGPSTYDGLEVSKPYIGAETEKDYLDASVEAIRIVRFSSFFGFFIVLLILFFLSYD